MRVKTGDRIELDAAAMAEPADNVVASDYHTSFPQIRLTGVFDRDATRPQLPTEVMLDGNDVARLVECALRHPSVNMRYGVLSAIWNHPDSFRQIFQFGLEAPEEFGEIRKIVAESGCRTATAGGSPAHGKTLLPQMPLPPHLQHRKPRT